MDLIVVLLMLVFIAMSWRLICRFWVGRGGKRWVGHALGFIFGPLIGIFASLPMVPGSESPATIGNLVAGLIILAGFVFLEYRANKSALVPATVKRSKRTVNKEPSQSSEDPAASSAAETTSALSFSLKDTAELILADDMVDQREAELLLNLLDKQDIIRFDPTCRALHQVLIASLEDGVLDNDEAEEIKALLSEICDRPIARPEKPSVKKSKPTKQSAATKKKTAPPKKRAPRVAREKSRTPQPDDILAFTYTDSKGDSSDREILYRSASQKGGVTYVKGICQTRKAFRTFRADRIEMLCFVDTGELVDSFGR